MVARDILGEPLNAVTSATFLGFVYASPFGTWGWAGTCTRTPCCSGSLPSTAGERRGDCQDPGEDLFPACDSRHMFNTFCFARRGLAGQAPCANQAFYPLSVLCWQEMPGLSHL